MSSRTRAAVASIMAAAAVAFAGTACSAQESEPVESSTAEQVDGAALGAALGAIAAMQGSSGAAVGAAVGAVVGSQAGSTHGK